MFVRLVMAAGLLIAGAGQSDAETRLEMKIHSKDAAEREEAALGEHGDRRNATLLHSVAQLDPDSLVREEAARALERSLVKNNPDYQKARAMRTTGILIAAVGGGVSGLAGAIAMGLSSDRDIVGNSCFTQKRWVNGGGQ